MQVPINQLTKNRNIPTDATSGDAVIGVWTTASRMATRVLNVNGSQDDSGNWVQVSRLGAPLVNEVVVPLGAKDLFNASKPENDAQFANGVTDPEVGKLLKALYNIKVPPQGLFGSTDARDDLVAIFLTGIPKLTQPANVVPSEQLRLNVAIAPTNSPNRLGVLGGDTAGYPNGRRLTDDVVDISLQAVAGAAYPLFHPGFVPDATGVKLGDGVDKTSSTLRKSFPYLGLPTRGFESVPHGSYSNVVNNVIVNNDMNNGNKMNPPALVICNITRHLMMSSTGRDVRCLQQFLKDKGFLKIISTTEFFGQYTKDALMKWQAHNNQEVTGYLN